MPPEMIAILAVGATLLGVGLTSFLTALQIILKRFDRLEGRMSSVEQGQARLEGLLDGIREALFERASR